MPILKIPFLVLLHTYKIENNNIKFIIIFICNKNHISSNINIMMVLPAASAPKMFQQLCSELKQAMVINDTDINVNKYLFYRPRASKILL